MAFRVWGDIMVEPMTAGAIASLLVTELAKSSAGEAGKKAVGALGALCAAIAKRLRGMRRLS
jgi:hypothetical protein